MSHFHEFKTFVDKEFIFDYTIIIMHVL